MEEKGNYDQLFNKLGFKDVRNRIFESLNKDIQSFLLLNNHININDLRSKFREFKKFKKSEMIYCDFIFELYGDMFFFYHKDDKNKEHTFQISNLKKFNISLNSDGSNGQEEWVFDESYLIYLINEVYQMKNPKIVYKKKLESDEISIISLKDDNINEVMNNDWFQIIDDSSKLDYDKILNLKKKPFSERAKEIFFIHLVESSKVDSLSKEYIEYKSYCSSFKNIFSNLNSFKKKTIFFHNEDIYFRFNLLQQLESKYRWGNFGNFYINFELFRNCKRQEKFERIAYFLSFLFPLDYDFQDFFEEKIKNLLTDKLETWTIIFNEIINYFEKYIFEKTDNPAENKFLEENKRIDSLNASKNILNNDKENKNIDILNDSNNPLSNNKENNKIITLSNTNNLLNNKNKKFLIIFDDILTKEEKDVVENIINNCSLPNFIFIMIYPLINDFTSNELINCMFKYYDNYFPFSLIFLNSSDFSEKSPNYFNIVDSKIFNENTITNEIILYDLIRIFKSIFVNSINSEINCKSIGFLTKYMKYLNILFDNKTKKIKDIAFKNHNIEKEFKNIYENTLTHIKTKNSNLFNNLLCQRDGFDLEKIIISTIILKQRKDFEILNLQSVFGLKDLEKNKNVNYEISNFFLQQKSLGGEMFDFAIKIIKDNKQYLKLTQITSDKSEEEKEKISIERMKINCSFFKKEFKDNKLGELDGISFCIIAPFRIFDNNKNYKNLKVFCKENNYELIFFNINNMSFYKREKKMNQNIDIFEINKEYRIEFKDFNEIMQIDKPLQILSLRKVKERDEKKEDSDIQELAKKYLNKNIKRVAKFEYKGAFSDLKNLNENYFAYIYYQKEISVYFYKDSIIKTISEQNCELKNYSDKKLILILFRTKIINKNYIDSSI